MLQPLAPKIMLIRHAEKPNDVDRGVFPTGRGDKSALSVRGWQRAGALAALFSPPPDVALHPALTTPRFLFASLASSQRPLQTLVPLSEKLQVSITGGQRGQEEELVRQVTACDGPVLISWQREQIPRLAKLLLTGSADAANVPASWPTHRFDVTWIFDLQSDVYRFSQLPHQLLAGDSDSPIQK